MAKFHNIDSSIYSGKTATAQIGMWAKTFENSVTLARDIQNLALMWLDRLEDMSKADIKEDIEAKYIFTNFPNGLDRGSLVAWVHKYSPIRVKFDRSTGRFAGLGVARKGAWNLDDASREMWSDCDPERTRVFKAAELERIVAQAAQAIAKVAYQNGTDTSETREALATLLDRGLKSAVTEYMTSEKFAAWMEECDAAKVEAARNVH